MKRIFAGLLACALACGCSGKRDTTVGGGTGGAGGSGAAGAGGAGGGGPVAGPCEGIRAKVDQLYRAEAQAKEPKRVDEAVADNTTMVMNDCAKAPAKVAACVSAAATVAELEKRCLTPLDDEGTEGEELRR